MEAVGPLISLCAGVLVGRLLAVRRRRRRLNERLHELRRPLHALALACEAEGVATAWLAQSRSALADLDRTINGGGGRRRRRAPAGDLVAEARRRWAPIAPVGSLEQDLRGSLPAVEVDADAVGAALDNLIANALEHGDGPVRLGATARAGAVGLRVESPGRLRAPERTASSARRGHGLRISARIAAEQGGRLAPPVESAGTVAAELELPAPTSR